MMVMPAMVKGVLPMLVRVTVLVVLVCPTGQEPKFSFLLENLTHVGVRRLGFPPLAEICPEVFIPVADSLRVTPAKGVSF